ncbi:hypothetical protein B7R21_16940 [Subtercola boreus]|uniref:HTH tetR-type domain-containing protein n=1 Tax=Subtercola boreus TaxID=120213 RepID=A0A3E0VAX4_9MICO|nr:TetR/AcrR family transcriptional regulator [Subtercola boreus]RFA07012.1 hypothetical protein B7R21_16940 [Subtercola boreus]
MGETRSEQIESTNPRVIRTKARVITVARELLPQVGPAALTYTLLADRAGVTRQTLYRHWPSREKLLAELVLTGPVVGYPEGGTDAHLTMVEFLSSLRAGMQNEVTAAALSSLMAQADRHADSADALRSIVSDRHAALQALLRPTGLSITAEQFAMLAGPVLFRRFIARQPVSDEFIEVLAELSLSAL